MQKLNNKIPQNIRIYLDEIADKLWMKPSRACVLVGAGFSRNAIKLQESTLTAPTWENLADDMIKKLYGNNGVNTSYTDILNVAEEYEAQYGKGELERFLKNKIPDNSLERSLCSCRRILRIPYRPRGRLCSLRSRRRTRVRCRFHME